MAKRLAPRLSFEPLTAETWPDLVELFGERGACGGCWCMYWRLPRAQFERQKGAGNRRALQRLVAAGRPLGVIAYDGPEPVGWCAVAPRADFPGLGRSRLLAPVDDEPVWSAPCLFVAREHRRRGVSAALLDAAARFAAAQGAQVLEGYPVDGGGAEQPAAFVWTGTPGAFARAGFAEVARRSPRRPIVRRAVAQRRGDRVEERP
ncbi:MAG: GNAT family N-acetyltransferase [Acidobacteria bacterium]|nr:GNAT family N-acetyltransferase [Acidobacteriota bacterium]